MKALAWFLLLMTSCAQAANLEFGVSQTSLGSAGDNIWYDQSYQHDNNLRPWGLQVGVSDDLTRWLGYRVTGIYFGQPINSAIWPEDVDYFAHRQVPPKYRGEGSGDVYGVTLAPVIFHDWENFRVSVEGGALIYAARWREQYQVIEGVEGGQWYYASKGWHTDWTPYAGVTAQYRQVFLSYRKYRDIYAVDSVFGNAASQLTLGWSKPF